MNQNSQNRILEVALRQLKDRLIREKEYRENEWVDVKKKDMFKAMASSPLTTP